MKGKLRKQLENALELYGDEGVDSAEKSLVTAFTHYANKDWTYADQSSMLFYLAHFALSDRRFAKAEALFRRLILIHEKFNQEATASLPQLYHLLAICCKAQDNFAEAEFFLQKALDLTSETLGTDSVSYFLLAQELGKPLGLRQLPVA